MVDMDYLYQSSYVLQHGTIPYMAAKKKKAKTVKKETPADLIQKKPNAFAVGSIALLLGVVAGVLLIQQRMPPQTKDQKRMGATPSTMQKTNQKQVVYKEYVMQENESLSDVAQRFYNDPNRYTKIAQENNILNPDIIEPGTKIKLYNLPQ